MHTLSNLHNLPHNLNRLKCTPVDYFPKPVWKNIHCLTLEKDQGKRSNVSEAIAGEEKEEKQKVQ